MQRALERGDAFPPLSTAVAAMPEETDSALESDLSERGKLEPGDAARGVTESGQTTHSRSASLCTSCGRALERATGNSVVDSLWARIPCPHGEQVHSSCMLDRAECFVRGHADPQLCFTCRSAWSARNRLPHPAEMAEDLPRPQSGGSWPAVGGALLFAEFIEEDVARLLQPASYVTRFRTVTPRDVGIPS